jgi:hypothetical protein
VLLEELLDDREPLVGEERMLGHARIVAGRSI